MPKAKRVKKTSPASAETTGQTAPEIAPSEARKNGRRLTLKFLGAEEPSLHRIAFTPKAGDDAKFWDQNDPQARFGWKELPQALSILFLNYLAWSKTGSTETFYFQGKHRDSFAAAIGNAINSGGQLAELFEECTPSGAFRPVHRLVFFGPNLYGKDPDKKDRRIFVSQNYLPPDCVEIFWDARGKEPLTELADLRLLEKRIRESDLVIIKDAPIVPTVEAREKPKSSQQEPEKTAPDAQTVQRREPGPGC